MGRAIDKITLKGFKSIESLEAFQLNKLNVLIGANGAGKSNFVDFFRMLRALADESFQQFVNNQGGGDGLMFLGPKVTQEIRAHLEFGRILSSGATDTSLSSSQQLRDRFKLLRNASNMGASRRTSERARWSLR